MDDDIRRDIAFALAKHIRSSRQGTPTMRALAELDALCVEHGRSLGLSDLCCEIILVES